MQVTKRSVVVIAAVLALAFAILVYWGLTHARSAPVAVPPLKRLTLVSPHQDKAVDLSRGVALAEWADLPETEVELVHQVMVLPWSKGLTPAVTVKSFHNDSDIYFLVTWKDETENRTLSVGEFSDAAALMFPLADDVPPSTLMMGFLGKQGVNIWHWTATRDSEFWLNEPIATAAYSDFHYPFEEQETLAVSKRILTSAVSDLIAFKVTTTTAKAAQNVQGRGVWDKGTWHVVFRRAMRAINPQEDTVFAHGTRKLVAFAVWDGARGDRGGRKSISDWVELEFR